MDASASHLNSASEVSLSTEQKDPSSSIMDGDQTLIESKSGEGEEEPQIKEESFSSAMRLDDEGDANQGLYHEVLYNKDEENKLLSPEDPSQQTESKEDPTPDEPSTMEEYTVIATENTASDSHRYFVIKPSTFDDVIRAYKGGPLSSSTNIMSSMKNALGMGRVTVFVNISGTRFFQGYGTAKLIETRQITPNNESDRHVMEGIGLDWKKLCHLSYDVTEEVINKMDGNRRVNAALDGQEVSPEAADRLMELCNKAEDETIDSCKSKLEQGAVRKRSASNDDTRKRKGKRIPFVLFLDLII